MTKPHSFISTSHGNRGKISLHWERKVPRYKSLMLLASTLSLIGKFKPDTKPQDIKLLCMYYDGRHGIDPVDQDLTEYHKQTVDISLSLRLSLSIPQNNNQLQTKVPPPKNGTLLKTTYFLGKSQIQRPSSTKQNSSTKPIKAIPVTVKSLTHLHSRGYKMPKQQRTFRNVAGK